MPRPLKIAREEVLEKAMQVFWDRGYCATSMARLVSHTGLQPGSLYAAFDSKEGLFLAVLDWYAQRSIRRLTLALADAGSPLEAIRHYFRQLAMEAAGPEAPRSCLLVNTALEQARLDAGVRMRVKQHFDSIEALLRDALETAARAGELPPEKDPASLAAFLMSSIWGLRVLGATQAPPERANRIVEQVLSTLDPAR